MKEPEDLKIKIGSPEQADWESILKQSKELVVTAKSNLAINTMIVELAKKKIKEEEEKFKKK